ncbi:MAG: hypothetical protein NTY02_12675 [Acidobacteria bacterium]|nr:hypothetical protein [Acidobacteriota bacterium]
MAIVALVAPVVLTAQMPDARQMSGIPMPSNDVPPGSVSVRLVRGDLSNNIVGHPVELHGGAKVETIKTDREGRASFKGIAPGLPVQAVALVDGERVESQTFALPAEAGVRLVLVAGAGISAPSGARANPPASAAVPGEVVFGGDSRIQIEFDDDTIEVFYLLDLVNAASAPVNPKSDLVIQLPEGAQQPSLLEGSSTQATLRGTTVLISGPFSPGTTPIQFAYSLAPAGASRTLVQTFPIGWPRVQVIMTRAGTASMASPQFASSNEMPGQGPGFILGIGGALAPGRPLSVDLRGLPSRSHLGRYLTIGIAFVVLLAGFYAASTARAGSGGAGRQAHLEDRRDKLMADLVRIEHQFRSGTMEESRYVSRHGDLVSQLERVYGELDQQSGTGGPSQGTVA